MNEDWEDEVARAYAVFGIDPTDTELALHFPKLSTSFLRTKALRQLRDRFGRWRQERGDLDLDEPERPKQAGDLRSDLTGWDTIPAETDQPLGARAWSTPDQRWPGGVRYDQVKLLKGEEARKGLESAGVDPLEALATASHSWVFTHDGKHYAIIPTPQAEASNDYILAASDQATAQDAVDGLTKTRDLWTSKGRSAPPPLLSSLAKARADLANANKRVTEAEKALDNVPQVEEPGVIAKAMARTSLEVLADITSRLPAWRQKKDGDGNPVKGWTATLDGSLFENDSKFGFTQVGSNGMYLNPRAFMKRPMNAVLTGWNMPAGIDHTGRYTINHEMGHMVDQRGPWESASRHDIWEKAKETGLLSTYGSSNVYEGYAEAFTMWLAGQHDHPVVKLYAKEFGWDDPDRPDTPPWIDSSEYNRPFTVDEKKWYYDFVDWLNEDPRGRADAMDALTDIKAALKVGDLPEAIRLLAEARGKFDITDGGGE